MRKVGLVLADDSESPRALFEATSHPDAEKLKEASVTFIFCVSNHCAQAFREQLVLAEAALANTTSTDRR